MPFDPSLDISIRFKAPATEVWSALTDEQAVAKWWPAFRMRIKRPGGDKFTVNAGPGAPPKSRQRVKIKILKIVPHEEIRLKLHSEPGAFDSVVHIYLSQLKHKSRLRVVESGLPDNGSSHQIVTECREAWRTALSAISEYVDGATP
ncbi:SRPBCC family protein [Gulosibacter chungangensis]|uniref:SRPBCC domain-containing protein n=1 Tax=Gulosibacter chungangensis TaxID=979746 RepID=A0A7J5BFL0_9MICO|nr:SRPBCC domain-containing protein [Gulosibacter chungangensis]KAB1644163.1 SRPBCC domain-containing protein [Gulosibacter chungangensis]